MNDKSVTSLRTAALCLFLALAVLAGGGPSLADTVKPPSIEQAAAYYALGALEAAEDEVRRFIATYPNDARRDDAIKLLAEIRIERERQHAVGTGSTASGAVSNVPQDRSGEASTPRLVDPRLLSSPPSQVLLKWERAFPGAPAQYRKDGVFAVTAEGGTQKTTIRIHTSGGNGEMAQQKTGTMLVIDIPGLVDALPQGGLDLPQGPATRVRHSQLSQEPLVARVVIDLKNAQVRAMVTSGDEEITIELEDLSTPSEGAPQGGLYRDPVAGARHIVEVLSGSHQRGFVADAAAEPVVVRVLDPVLRAPMAGVAVEFRAVDAGLRIETPRVTTTADGVASTRIRFDEVAGRKVVQAAVVGTPAEVSFELYALPRPPDSVRKVDGEAVKVRTRQNSTTPLAVIVQDEFGNPIPGVEVSWSYVQGGGSVDADPDRAGVQTASETDRDGKATLRQWATGPRAGVQRIQAAFTTGGVTRFTQFEIDVMPQLVSMDFFQTPVPDILRFLGRIANWNLLLSDGVNAIPDANITVHLENVPIDEALDKILQMKGLTRLEESDGSIRILTFTEAQTRGQAVVMDPALLPDLPQNVVRTVIVPVRRRNMDQMVTLVKDVLTPEAKVFSDPATGQIVITDFVVNIRRAVDLVTELERGLEARVLRVQHVDAKGLEEFLKNFLSAEERLIPKAGGFLFVGSPASAAQLERLIAEIDRPENGDLLASTDATVAVTRVFQLDFTEAKQLQPLLSQLFAQTELRVTVPGQAGAAEGARAGVAAEQAATQQQVVQKILVVADERSNKLIVTAPELLMPSIAATVRELDTVVAAARPLVVGIQGVDIALVNTMIAGLYPGLKVFQDAATGRLVLFVPPTFDAAPLQALFASLSQAGSGEVVSVRIHYLQNLPEAKAIEVLTAIFGAQSTGSGEAVVRFIDPGTTTGMLPIRFLPLARPGRQGVILIGTTDKIERALEVIDELDTAPLAAGETVVVRKLIYANADQMAGVLRGLQQQAQQGGAGAAPTVAARRTPADAAAAAAAAAADAGLSLVASARISDLKLVTDARTNSIILIGPFDIVASINRLIDSLDQRVGVWEVVPLKNADAVDVSATLLSIFPTARILSERSSNSIFIVANTAEEIPEIKRAVQYLDQARGTRIDDTTIVIQLRRADATEVTNILTQIFSNNALLQRSISIATGGEQRIAGEFFDYLREQDRRADRQNLLRLYPVVTKNLIVLQAPAFVAKEALGIIAKIEEASPFSDPTAGQYVRVYVLKHLLPSQLVQLIRQSIDEERLEVQEFTDPVTGRATSISRRTVLIRTVAEDSLKSLIATATTREHVQVEQLISNFDNETFANQRELQFSQIRVRNANATILGKWIRDNILNAGATTGEMIFVSASDSRIMLWVYAATMERLNRVLPTIDRREFNALPYRIYQPSTISAPNFLAMLTVTYPAVATSASILEEVGAVIVFADQSVLDEIEALQKNIDIGSARILPVRNFDVSLILEQLRTLHPNVEMTALTGAREILVTGERSQVEAVASTLAKIDGQQALTYRAYQVRQSEPARLLQHLRRLVLNRAGGELSGTGVDLEEFATLSGDRIHVWARSVTHDRIRDLMPTLDVAGLPVDPTVVYSVYTFRNASISGLRATSGSGISGDDILQTPITDLLGSARITGLQTFVASAQGNFVLLIGMPDAVARAEEYCRTIDEAWARNVTNAPHRVYTVRNRAVSELLADVSRLVAGHGVEMIQLAQTNQVLVVAPPDIFARTTALIAEFDTVTPVRSVQLMRRDPTVVATLLTSYYPDLSVTSLTAPNALVLRGAAHRIAAAEQLIKSLDININTRVLKYGRIPSADAQALVTTFYPNVSVQLISEGSILVAEGMPENLAGAERLLADIEAGLEWKIVPLSRITSANAITLVNDLFGSVRVTALPAGNGVAMMGTSVNMAEALKLIEQIDRRDINLIPVREAELASVASTLTTLFPEASINTMSDISAVAVSADPTVISQIQRFVSAVDRKVHTAIRPLQYYDPTTSGELTQLSSTLQTYLSTDGRIFFDRQSNAFVITDSLERVERALRVLDDLDRQPPQFLIEAIIAEVELSDEKTLGVSWTFRPDLTAVGLYPMATITNPAVGGSNMTYNTGGEGTYTLGLTRSNLQAALTALLSKGDGRIVATPKIVTRNNIEGRVSIQQSFPYTTSIPATATTPAQTTTEFQDVPIVLTVTPSSTWNSPSIRMTVEADISVALAATATGAQQTQSRIVNTTVDMRDGQTLIIGGLMQKTIRENVTKVPVLGDIPGIGNLFRSTGNSEVNREVLIFLSPRLIFPQTHDLQMEEELNRYKYLVNFPADWSGRRWLANNPQRTAALRAQMTQGSNFIVTPGSGSAAPTAPAATPAASPAAPTFVPAPVSSTPSPSSYVPPASAVPAPPTAAYAPQPQSGALLGATSTVDVNTATALELRSVPEMPAHVAELIVKFREANGVYRSLQDLLRVPGMTTALLDRTAKYLRVAQVSSPVAPTPPAAYTPPSAYTPPPASPAPAVTAASRVNLNTASVEELKTLPGILDNHARMIVAYRNTYGSFATTDQLIDVPGISPQMYGRIRDLVTVGGAARAQAPVSTVPSGTVSGTLNINTATEQELVAVGFTPQQARLIISYRNSYGAYGSIDELVDVPTITPQQLESLRPRLSVSGGSALAPTRSEAATPVYGSASASAGPVVDLNAATEADLMAIPGFSIQNVKLIISYRTTYGSFTSVDELLEVPSITPEILAQVRSRLSVR